VKFMCCMFLIYSWCVNLMGFGLMEDSVSYKASGNCHMSYLHKNAHLNVGFSTFSVPDHFKHFSNMVMWWQNKVECIKRPVALYCQRSINLSGWKPVCRVLRGSNTVNPRARGSPVYAGAL